jgi:hypothetical protein
MGAGVVAVQDNSTGGSRIIVLVRKMRVLGRIIARCSNVVRKTVGYIRVRVRFTFQIQTGSVSSVSRLDNSVSRRVMVGLIFRVGRVRVHASSAERMTGISSGFIRSTLPCCHRGIVACVHHRRRRIDGSTGVCGVIVMDSRRLLIVNCKICQVRRRDWRRGERVGTVGY